MLRSFIYVPSNSPSKILNSLSFNADAIVFDLEDSIPLNEKEEARYIMKYAIKDLPFKQKIFVRVNHPQTEFFKEDIKFIPFEKIYGIKVPKVKDPKDLEIIINSLKETHRKIKMLITIENLEGLENLKSILNYNSDLIGVSLGIEDLALELGIKDTKNNFILNVIKAKLVMEAKLKKLLVIDSVYSDFKYLEGLKQECILSKNMGFDGKSAIHPEQLEIINRIFSIEKEEMEYAKKVVQKYLDLGKPSLFSFEGKMIDKPILERFFKILSEE